MFVSSPEEQVETILASGDRDARLRVPQDHQMVDLVASVNKLLDMRDAEIAELRQKFEQKVVAHEDDLTTNALLRQTKEMLRHRSQELKAALMTAAASNEAKSSFLANVSHELRTPMNGVIGMAELLLRTPLNEHQAKLAKTIVESGRALVLIINDILDFSKIEAGKIELRLASFDFKRCVNDVTALVGVQASAKSIELTAVFGEQLPELVVGDAGRIRQILTNLIGNAVKFTEQGSVQVCINSNICNEHVELGIDIIDTGPGIPKSAIDVIFEKFNQVDSTFTRDHEGTGLGLAICKLLVEQMGGEIGVESELEIGSRFHFSLRLPIEQSCQTDANDAHALVNKTVCIVGGSSANATDLIAALADKGCQTQIIENLEDAKLQAKDVDVVVLTCQDVETDGMQRIKAFKRQNYGLDRPIIISTDVGTIGDGAMLQAAGAQGYMTADTSPHIRCQIVSMALTHHAADSSELVTKHHTESAELPKELPRTQSESPSDLHLPESSSQDQDRIQCHVLVVDDGLVNRSVASEFLQFMGCDVALAENGQEAVDLTESESYDLILMDCQMPKMDGLEATKFIRNREVEQRRPRLPIIALTANAFESDRKRCLEAGMDDFLAKPLEPNQLEAIIAKFNSPTNQPEPISQA